MLTSAGCSGVSFHGGDALKTMYTSRVDGLKTKYGRPEDLEAAIAAARIAAPAARRVNIGVRTSTTVPDIPALCGSAASNAAYHCSEMSAIATL